jgi:glutathione reductase (NADPH)
MSHARHVMIIGAGTAGTRAARTLAGAGWRVTVVEHGQFGGTCLWHGCVPKKALYTAAQTRREAAEAARMGFAGGPPDLDWARLMAWKGEMQRAYAGDQEGILTGLGAELVRGEARFLSPDEVTAGGAIYRPSHVLVATGSRPLKPPFPRSDLADTSDDALEYAMRPATLAIIGGGYIAMEFAGIYAAFGTQVTVVVRGGDVLKGFDPEAVALARAGLETLGVTFHLHTETRALEGGPGALNLRVAGQDGRERALASERVLAAVGRAPALDDLDLAAGKIEVSERGRPLLDASLRSTSNPRVWFAGDAAGGIELTPVAGLEGERVADSMRTGEPQTVDLAGMPSACFTVPQVARVGLGEAELAARGAPYQVARGGFEYVAQAIIDDRRDGLVKLLAGEDGRLLGAHLACPQAAELIHTLGLAIRAGATLDDLRDARPVHPTLSEALNWAAFSVETVMPQARA